MADRATVVVAGVEFDRLDMRGALDRIAELAVRRPMSTVVTPNVDLVVIANRDPVFMATIRRAELVLADGQPVVWAMNALGHNLTNRVYGPDLMAKFCERSALTGARMFLYGGRNQGALVQLALNLRRRFDGLQVVGGYSPPFRTLSEEEIDAVVAEINHAKPDVVWVGIGVPKQEKWMARMRPRLSAPVLIGVGAAFDFHAGLVPQAPPAMQRLGLEWLFRLSKEPRRLWKRYLTYNPRFVFGFARQYARHRRSRARGDFAS